MSENVSWDEAISNGKFVKLVTDEEKILVCENPKLEKVEKFGNEVIEFQTDVIEEDGLNCSKFFNTSSNRLKKKLRPLFETYKLGDKVKLSILKVGDKFDTQFVVAQQGFPCEIVSNLLNKFWGFSPFF